MTPILYPDQQDVIDLVRSSGWYARDVGALLSAVERPRQVLWGTETYPDLWTKAAALLDAVNRSHPLLDGNKRLAWLLTAAFCQVNGHVLIATAHEIDTFVRHVAAEHPPIDDIAAWLSQHAQ